MHSASDGKAVATVAADGAHGNVIVGVGRQARGRVVGDVDAVPAAVVDVDIPGCLVAASGPAEADGRGGSLSVGEVGGRCA